MKRTYLSRVLLMLTLLTWAQQHVPDTLGLGVEAETWFTRSDHTDKSGRVGLVFNHQRFDIYGSLTFDDPLHVEEGSVVHSVRGDSLWQQQYAMRREWGGNGYMGNVGMNFQLRPNHQIGVAYHLIHTPASDDHGGRTGSERMDITWNNGNVMTHQVNAYYRGQLQRTSIALDAEYYSHKQNVNMVIEEDAGDGMKVSSNNFRLKRSHVLALTLALDHAWTHGSLDWGATYLHTRHFDHYQADLTQPMDRNRFIYHRFIPYVNHTLKMWSWQLATGLQFDSERHEAFWLPALRLTRSLGEAEVSLDYQTSVHRPAYQWLTTHVVYQSRYDREKGYADLKAAYQHQLSVKGSWKFVEGSIGYEDLRDAVVQTADQPTGSPTLTYWTHANLHSLKSVFATVALSPVIGLWSPTLHVDLRRQWLTLHTDYGRQALHTPLLTAALTNAFHLGKGWQAEANFHFRSKGDARNVSYVKCSWTTDLSLSKSFLGDRLFVKVEGDDLLHGLREATRLYDKHTMLLQDLKYNSRHVIVTLRYSFNMTHRPYRGHEAGQAEKSRF